MKYGTMINVNNAACPAQLWQNEIYVYIYW